MSQPPVPGQRQTPPPPLPPPPPPPPPPGAPASPLQQLIQAQTGNRGGDATGYLRAAAHLDPAFRDAVIEELAENPHRIPPPSFGIDLVAVLKECFEARRRASLRALIMLVIPFVVMPVDVAGALLPLYLVVSARWSLFLTRKLTGLLARLAARLGDPDAARWVRRLSGLLWLLTMVGIVFVSGGTLWGLWDGGVLGGSGGTSCGYDAYGGYQCSSSSGPESGSGGWAALIVLAGWTAVAALDRYRRVKTLHLLATSRAEALPEGARGARYQRLRQQQADPDVVYSDYRPFVGAGIEVDHWSFAIELVPDTARPNSVNGANGTNGAAVDALAKSPRPPAAFTVPAVHAHLRRELLRLGGTAPAAPGTYPGDRLHGISVDDYVFKSGLRVGPAQDWSGSGPDSAFARMAPYAARAAAGQLSTGDGVAAPPTWWPDSLDLAAEERLRHYLAVRVGSWGEELVLTVFTRVQLQGGLLFLENRAFLLPPIARAYHAVDTTLPPVGAGDWTGLVLRSLGSSIGLASHALPDLYRAVRTVYRTERKESWYRRMCAENRPVDHGPACSVRELGAEPEFQQLFQEMDMQRFLKSIETRTLTAVRDCLREHGYRTDEYEARQSVVINNGVQVTGNVTGNVQTGSHARAAYQQVSPPQPRVGTPNQSS